MERERAEKRIKERALERKDKSVHVRNTKESVLWLSNAPSSPQGHHLQDRYQISVVSECLTERNKSLSEERCDVVMHCPRFLAL